MLRLNERPEEERSGGLADPRWWGASTTSTFAGRSVTATSSLQLLTVASCVKFISDAIATLPIDVYRKVNGQPEEMPKPAWLLHPTVELTFTEWCTQVLSSLLLDGNAYLFVSRNTAGAIVELQPVSASRVSVRREGSKRIYTVDGVDLTRGEELLHLKGWMLAGSLTGLSPVEYARQSIGLGLAALEYGGQFFDGEGNMPGVIEAPRVMPPDRLTAMAENWRRRRQKGGRGLPGILDDGATFKPTGVTNEQAQFLATRGYTAAEIAGQMFLIDPTDLGIPVEGSQITYANLEQRNVRRVQVTYLPWITRLEEALSALLSNPRYMKFNVSGLLRGDTLSRWQTYGIAERINKSAQERGASPVLETSEMRAFEEYPPVRTESE